MLTEEEKKKHYWNKTLGQKIFKRDGRGGVYFNKLKLRSNLSYLLKYDITGTRILGVGAGIGYVEYVLRFLYDKTKPIVTDYSYRGMQIAKMLKLPAVNCSCEYLPFKDNSFDVIINFDMLEHVEQEKRINFIREARRVLTNEGAFFITIPTTRDYHWEGVTFRVDPYMISIMLNKFDFEVMEIDFYKKQYDREACFIAARRYNHNNWWKENKGDYGHYQTVDYDLNVTKCYASSAH